MAKAKKTKSKAAPQRQSEAVYSRRGPTNPRTLGSTLNHDHCTIPSSTFRTLDQTIPRSQLRTHGRYEWNMRTGKGKMVEERADVIAHAQDSIVKAKFRPVTDGYRQRYERKEAAAAGPSHHDYCVSSPTPLGGSMGRRQKERY